MPASLGRTVADNEVTTSSAPVAILGYGFWQSHFAGAASVIGKTIDLDGTPTRIVGVMPKGFSFPRPDIALYQPFAADPRNASAGISPYRAPRAGCRGRARRAAGDDVHVELGAHQLGRALAEAPRSGRRRVCTP